MNAGLLIRPADKWEKVTFIQTCPGSRQSLLQGHGNADRQPGHMRFANVDRVLLERCRSGEYDAFEQLCCAIREELYCYVYSILRDHDRADETVQECLVRVYRHLPGLEDPDKFPWWLSRMAVNQCKSYWARENARPTTALDDSLEVPNERLVASAAPAESPREAAQKHETEREIRTAIESLPERQRAAIVLFELEQHPIREVAALLGCSEGAVKFHIHEARKKLKERLAHHLCRTAAGGKS